MRALERVQYLSPPVDLLACTRYGTYHNIIIISGEAPQKHLFFLSLFSSLPATVSCDETDEREREREREIL